MPAARGEASFQAGERSLTFVFDFNALCAIEEELDRPLNDVMTELTSGKARLVTLRAIVWGGLIGRQPDMTVAEAGDLLVGDVEGVTGAMRKALEGSMLSGAGGAGGNPPKARTARSGSGS